MHFDLTRPCDNCPFRSDIIPYLDSRCESLAEKIMHHTFECHKTVYGDHRDERGRFKKRVRQHCAGALIVMEKQGQLGDMQQIAERLGIYDPRRLDFS